MLKQLHNRVSIGKNWYNTYKKTIKLVSNIPLKNNLLYKELEQAGKKYDGILTYAEFLTIEQFGKNGFYTTSDFHGITDVETRWGQALAQYCKKFGHDTIIEFGCGTGELGIATAQAYKRQSNKPLTWIGVEIDNHIHKNIEDNFTSNGLQNAIEKIASSISEIPNKKNALVVFPYSLDNIPPHVFLNTKPGNSYPDALLGIIVANDTLSEIIIPPEVLAKKGIKLTKGYFTQDNCTFKLTGWQLRKGQRAYISTDAFATLSLYTKKFPDSTILIIDEFAKAPHAFTLGNIGTPKSLYEKNLSQNDLTRYYRESGMHNLYYPLYKDTLLKFLSGIGFRSVYYEIEQKMAAKLNGKKWFPIAKEYSTYVFIAKDFTDKRLTILPVSFPAKRIF